MGHDKLRKFAENETFSCLIQPSADELLADGFLNLRDHALKGRWAADVFGGEQPGTGLRSAGSSPSGLTPPPADAGGPPAIDPRVIRPRGAEASSLSAGLQSKATAAIVLELGCGKGEYTLELARRNPDKCYIGVDIKGARLWRGAKTATEEALPNVAFLRTRIEFIGAFFAPGEISEIWLTFSDPQMKSENSRLTSPVFLERYRKFLKPGGIVHLKTDSRFLHEYTKAVVAVNGFRLLACTGDLYGAASTLRDSIPKEVREVQTYYESMFLKQGLPITYMAFTIDGDSPVLYPRDPEDFNSRALRAAEKSRLEHRDSLHFTTHIIGQNGEESNLL